MKLHKTPHGKRLTGKELEHLFSQEEDRLQKLEEDLLAGLDSEEKMEEENKDDKATKSSGKDNSTPPKLFLGYAAMVFNIMKFLIYVT